MKRSFLKDLASFFALYGILFIPFPFFLIEAQSTVTDLIFGKLIGFVSANVFGRALPDNSVYSDSTSMYILVLLLFILAAITALLLQRWNKWQLHRSKALDLIYKLCVYYLALQLLKYGVDKIFKNQFYLPEPNTLYTPLGQLDKDILYWSSMGTSHFYSVFMGLLEAIAAAFLLFKKARLVGLLLTLAVMLNVVAVNFGFDIGVKLFSLFLLFLAVYLLVPFARSLYRYLTRSPGSEGQMVNEQVAHTAAKRTFAYFFIKCLVIGLILLESFSPFLRTMNFNGDTTKRHYLHGAYEVEKVIRGEDTLTPGAFPFKRFFVHRDNYMIFQDQQERMKDYKMSFDHSETNKLWLTDYDLSKTCLYIDHRQGESTMTVKFVKDTQLMQVMVRAIDWRKLPALRKGFHWTTD